MKKTICALAAAGMIGLGSYQANAQFLIFPAGDTQQTIKFGDKMERTYTFGGKYTRGSMIEGLINCLKHASQGKPFAEYLFNEKGDYSISVVKGKTCIIYDHNTKKKSNEFALFVNPGGKKPFQSPLSITDKYALTDQGNQKDRIYRQGGKLHELNRNFFEGDQTDMKEPNLEFKKRAFEQYHRYKVFLNVEGLENAIKGRKP